MAKFGIRINVVYQNETQYPSEFILILDKLPTNNNICQAVEEFFPGCEANMNKGEIFINNSKTGNPEAALDYWTIPILSL